MICSVGNLFNRVIVQLRSVHLFFVQLLIYSIDFCSVSFLFKSFVQLSLFKTTSIIWQGRLNFVILINLPREHVASGRRRGGRGQAWGREAVSGERGVSVAAVRCHRGGRSAAREGRGDWWRRVAEAAVAALAVARITGWSWVAQVHVVGRQWRVAAWLVGNSIDIGA